MVPTDAAGKTSPGTAWLYGQTVSAVLLVILILQLRNPHFTLIDDNLTAGYPFYCEIGRHLKAGESPFISQHLFSGNYPLLYDAQYFAWHPVYLLNTLFVDTPLQTWILDLDALFLYLVTACGFVALACYLRQQGYHGTGDGWILFLALSYTFSSISLVTCTSWLTFEANIGALPWLLLGILHHRRGIGLGIITLASVHQWLGGHLEPLVTNTGVLSLIALVVSLWRKSQRPFRQWIEGNFLALVLISPLLLPMLQGFTSTARSHGTLLSDMGDNNIPAPFFASSFFLGQLTSLLHVNWHETTNGIFILSLPSCAAAWCLLPVLGVRPAWRFLDLLTVALMSVFILMVIRPMWINEILIRLPIVAAMRWPFRELIQLQFFVHLLIVLRIGDVSSAWPRFFAWLGATCFAIPLLLFPCPPTFNTMPLDREVILHGKLMPYWAELEQQLGGKQPYVVLVPGHYEQDDSLTVPFSLLGAYNYSMLTGWVNATGYSQTPPAIHPYLHTPIRTPWGGFYLDQAEELWHERPDLRLFCVESYQPLRVTLRTRDQPPLDLTPLIEKTLHQP